MKQWLVVSLVANVVLAGVLVNHYLWLKDLDERADKQDEAALDEIDSIARAFVTLEGRIDSAETDLDELTRKVGSQFDPSSLQSQVEDASTGIQTLTFRVNSLASQVDDLDYFVSKPPGCFTGDPVYWHSNGLTC